MKQLRLHPKVPAQAKRSKGNEIQELVRKVAIRRVKVMTMVRMIEKVKREARKLALLAVFTAKQGSRVTGLIRIQMEETKRKVRVSSPEALSFIGPGDQDSNLFRRGGLNEYRI
jgi:hypothetical protein